MSTLKFTDKHTPTLKDGKYTITLTQDVNIKKTKQPGLEATSYTFHISSPRFSLNSQDVLSVFPPSGSLGDHANVLPHIQFQRSTLPWEREPGSKDKDGPWLALLVLYDDEVDNKVDDKAKKFKQSVGILKNLTDTPQPQVLWNPITLETELGQNSEDPVTIIEIDAQFLEGIFPDSQTRQWLTHVRTNTETPNKERAVIIANRLPKANGSTIVHLVSLEGQDDVTTNTKTLKDGDKVRLVSLYSWRFTCVSPDHTFLGLLKNLNCNLPGVLRLPRNENVDAEAFLKRGAVALGHETYYGKRTVSWYHGPFVPGNFPALPMNLPASSSNELLYYNKTFGMFDTSYAVAWELGRLLIIQSKSVATALYNWKRQHAQAKKLFEIEHRLMHLALGHVNVPDGLPQNVVNWFQDLSCLKGVPFRYLVPDEHMLPPKSLRFFQVDSDWMRCLIDGAFSIGRVLASDHAADSGHFSHEGEKLSNPPRSGFLLRSAVVSGWPDLRVGGQQQPSRQEKLSENVLLCLFQELVATVNIGLKPEALHFGLDGGPDTYTHTLRNKDGKLGQTLVTLKMNNRVVDWKDLNESFKKEKINIDSALLAFQMIKEQEQVQFTVT